MLAKIKACIIIPTYNNELTLSDVLQRTLDVVEGGRVIVINDGSTDSTPEILESFEGKLDILVNEENQGKGYSLAKGFRHALSEGYEYAITIDSDGQHFPEDIPLLLDESKLNPGHVIMGSRNMNQEGVPGKSSFGNEFSNFWFRVETTISLPDTQTGYRLYPLLPMKNMKFFTKKFEFEIELIVRLAWRGVKFTPVPIRVIYDMDERVSHFRPGRDFFRISVLNSVLCIIALIYFYPKKLFSLNTLKLIKEETIKPQESNARKAFSLGFGCFMGIIPIWGFQLLIGIPLAVLFRLNKVLFIAAANISIPPMIPIIIYASLLVGQQVVAGEVDHGAMLSFSLDDIQANLLQYIVGATILALLAFATMFIVSFFLLKIFRKEPSNPI